MEQPKTSGNPPQPMEQSQDLPIPSPQPLVSKFEDLKGIFSVMMWKCVKCIHTSDILIYSHRKVMQIYPYQ